MKIGLVFVLVVSCVSSLISARQASAQEYRFLRSIGQPPAVGEPRGLAVDAKGNIYVADRGNGRILRITATGRLETARLETARLETTVFQTTGRVKRPVGVTVTASGNIFVADEAPAAVLHFAPSGRFISTLGILTAAPAQVALPGGIASDFAGNIYISDQANHRIRKFDSRGRTLATFGNPGSQPGEFRGPRGIAVDRAGNIYVADEFNHRIQKLDPNGNFVAASDPKVLGETVSEGLGPMSVAVDSKGNVWVAAHTNFAVYKLDPRLQIVVRLEAFGRRDGELAGPINVAVDAVDNVYILDNSRRIQKFNSLGNFISRFAFPDARMGELSAPTGVAVDSDGNLYVCDTANFRIQKFDRTGRPLLTFGRFGQGDGEFNGGESISIDRQGVLYVVDSYNHRIQKFDSTGRFLGRWGAFGSLPGEFKRTKAVVVDPPRDWVYVNDWHNNRVQKFDLNGGFLAAFGDSGPAKSRVLGPTGIAVDGDGNVYVSSWYNNAIQKFDSSGRFITTIGGPGTADGQFNGPARLAIDGSGRLVVADWGNNRVQILAPDGRFVTKFGAPGRGDGFFDQPVGVAADTAGNLFVGDAANARVQMFERLRTSIVPRGPAQRVLAQVSIYDVLPGTAAAFEAALIGDPEQLRNLPGFVNERILRNIDPLTQQYASYTKFTDRASAEQALRERAARLHPFLRRPPEVHIAELRHAYFPGGISDQPRGNEFDVDMTRQVAHLGFFIPFPAYRRAYDDVLQETKVLTRAKQPSGYIGEDLLVETDDVSPPVQTPYSPRATEPARMSINYGEYRTLENAEDAYISRQQIRDPKLVTMERVFFSALQVPTRFYIFEVIANHRTSFAASAR
jgi:tripartite motif-containing protein 71